MPKHKRSFIRQMRRARAPGRRTSLARVAELARTVCPAYGVRKLELFGSHARKTATAGSDIDLIATFDNPPGLEIVSFQRDLESRLGTRVDLFEAESIAEMRNPFRKAAIEADRTTIYEA